ncbi:CDP-glycerol glycerophosphotransferase, TagB/SpsB family [Butyrivibrio sp. Su6]|uniref:CDP-glycerol glycerophosphotransferase family protein n=1 Tax=Butyrivibrio sp. Su6 TaxID=1520810 RepID=UPI00089E9B7A|nr:CDP-glycerol glycerophosphotransferase family protein [Butyrivibrio sp. Su6]SEG25743.1 CDP-glycerol glycerophosphotransferase, TagB/SpsB family [Butyrivibrio sp. Su6]
MGNFRILKRYVFIFIRKIGRGVYKKRIWLISDREMSAGDNGEAFFKYLQDKKVDSVFAISKKSADYERLNKIGKVVDYGSLTHKFLSCISECHCSSQLLHMENHCETKQIFLQHGVAAHDLSKMLKEVAHKNFYVITSGKQEYEYMLKSNRQIDASHLWLTGLPRFDLLESRSKKMIGIAFTMRHKLLGQDPKKVMDTEYFRTIGRLFEDQEIRSFLASNGYELRIKMHPEMEYFEEYLPAVVKEKIYRGTYQSFVEESMLLVTDYSSIAFDFAYLGKAVIYYQFDDTYYDNPYTSKGKYDYENGLGPLTIDYDAFLDVLKKMVLNQCKLEEKYRQRAKEFFAYMDRSNCQRVYEKVKSVI